MNTEHPNCCASSCPRCPYDDAQPPHAWCERCEATTYRDERERCLSCNAETKADRR